MLGNLSANTGALTEEVNKYNTELRAKIEKDILGDKSKAVVIDSDIIKKINPEYDPNNPSVMHEESSAISKELFTKAVDRDSSGVVRLIGGGSGSGKSEVILSKIGNEPSVVFDGTMSKIDSAKQKIDYALSKGKKVEIYPVYTPIELATLFNKLRDRSVSDAVLVDSHFGMRNTMSELAKHYGEKIKIIPHENKIFDKNRKYTGQESDMSVIENSKVSKEELQQSNELVNSLIDKYGLDVAKKVINSIISM